MYTYYANPKIKEEKTAIAKKRLKKKNEIYIQTPIGCLLFIACLFLGFLTGESNPEINTNTLLNLLIGSIGPIGIGIISLIYFIKETRRTYFKSEKERVTLYNDYMEYSYMIDDIETTYRVSYKDITSFSIIEKYDKYELVIIPRNVKITHNNRRTLIKKTDDSNKLRRIEILYCFDNGDEMFERIQEAVFPNKEKNEKRN